MVIACAPLLLWIRSHRLDTVQAGIDAARLLVLDLKEPDQLILSQRLDIVRLLIDEMEDPERLLAEATTAVEKVEESLEKVVLDSARSLVNNLPNPEEKQDLTNRLNSVQAFVDGPIIKKSLIYQDFLQFLL